MFASHLADPSLSLAGIALEHINNHKDRKLAGDAAKILTDLGMDSASIVVSILQISYAQKLINQAEVLDVYGQNILDLLIRIAQIQDFSVEHMLASTIVDVRAVVIKLALHTCNMRQAYLLAEQSGKVLAQLSQKTYIPLANRLGIGQIKLELEDLSFKLLEPTAYANITKLLDEDRVGREEYLQEVIDVLSEALAGQNITAAITGRVKHAYSLWKKMHAKMASGNAVYDVRAIRVLVAGNAECYMALGIVHALWSHIPREFDDYITNPKSNGYKSLHTTVVAMDGKMLEIQIRTTAMHRLAELGVAAHWKYKAGAEVVAEVEKSANLRQLINWQQDCATNCKLTEPVAVAEITIPDIGKLICDMAKCCKPIFGDSIVGYITLEDGVTIHKKDCLNILQVSATNQSRLIHGDWKVGEANIYEINVVIKAYQRIGLLRNITDVLMQERVDIKFINTLLVKQEHLVEFKLKLEVASTEILVRILAALHKISHVYDVYREESKLHTK